MKKIHGSSAVAHINPQKLEKMKISFLFSSVLLISALLGMLVANYISTDLYANSIFRISNHFETAFLGSSDFLGYAKIVALYSLSDIIVLSVIFAASFSILNYLVTDAVLFFCGMKFGVSTAFLIGFSRLSNLPYCVGNTRLCAFVLAGLIWLMVLLYYSCYAAISSTRFKLTDSSGRPNVKTVDFIMFTLKTVACVGAVIILNAVYCFSIYILK